MVAAGRIDIRPGDAGLRPCAARRTGAGGFTLLELILAISILMLLAGTAVMAFGPWQRQAALGDGAQRLATLLRACQAVAADTGCRVQVRFASAEDSNAPAASVQWEPQPLTEPGVFQPYQGSLVGTTDLADMVRVENCKLTGPSAPLAAGAPGALPPVTFYPDGSSDWAQVFVASSYASDLRRAIVQINGTTGTIRTTLYANDQYEQEVAR
jgi:type II secretory pathway pseudopilin PulG